MTVPTFWTTHTSPIGELLLTSNGQALTGLHMEESTHPPRRDPAWIRDDIPFHAARTQLDDYFANRRRRFDLPLAPAGTPFQRKVWEALLEIPFGSTASYGEIARRVGAPRAVRAVGGANGRNPIAIVIPCHRVIGGDGSLTGFGGGLERKRFLLELEGGPPGSLRG